MADLLALADDETRDLWADLRLGYTESTGHPLLRREIATLYDTIEPDEVLTSPAPRRRSSACRTSCSARRSCRRHLARLPEPVRGRPSGRRRRDPPRAAGGGRLGARPGPPAVASHPGHPADRRQRAPQPDGHAAGRRARRWSPSPPSAGVHLLLDEVYASSSSTRRDSLPAGADACERGISLGVMSKSFAMAGLRIGWLATRDRELLGRCAAFKDYTTICSSAPSEILASSGCARGTRSSPGRAGSCGNLALLDAFFADRADRFAWVRPRGRLDRLPAPDLPASDRRLGGRTRRGRRRPAPAGLAVRARGEPLPDRLRSRGPAGGPGATRGPRRADVAISIPGRLGIVTLAVDDLARSIASCEASSGPLAGRSRNGRSHNGRVDPTAAALDRPFDGQPRPDGLVRGGTEASAIACFRIGLQPWLVSPADLASRRA